MFGLNPLQYLTFQYKIRRDYEKEIKYLFERGDAQWLHDDIFLLASRPAAQEGLQEGDQVSL
jgi:hypothetical protein